MGLAELIGRLERDASARVAAVKEKARIAAEQLSSSASTAAASELERQLNVRRAERRSTRERELATARQRARGEELRARHQALERIFTAARALAASAEAEPTYLASLPALLSESLSYLEGVPAVVRCRPTTAARIRALLTGRSDVEVVEAPDAAVGISVEARDGSVAVDDTLIARLRRLEPRLSVGLLSELER